MANATGRCAYPWQQMIIDPTGDVTPCCYYHAYGVGGLNSALGNTNEQTIEEIWNGEAYRCLRQTHLDGDIPAGHPCHKCLSFDINKMYPPFETKAGVWHDSDRSYATRLDAASHGKIAGTSPEALVLLEDGREIGRGASAVADVRAEGRGRFAIHGDTVYFSTSAGDEPLINGKAYTLVAGDARVPLPCYGYDVAAPSAANLRLAHREFTEGRSEMQAKPTHLGYASSVDCNIDCGYCSQNQYRAAGLQLRNETLDDVKRILPSVSYFTWAGGEPFFLKPFRDFVAGFERSANPNLLFGFTSNGTMIGAREIAKLKKFPRISASVSIDSFDKDLFEVLRAPAKFDRVIGNFLALQALRDDVNWQIQCGLLVMKANMHEIDRNIAFAIEHGVELNLSPILQYPVTERLDIFTDFAEQTRGWLQAVERAIELCRRAKAEGRLHYDMEGALQVVRRTVEASGARYADCVIAEVTVIDPSDSLRNMRNPGVSIGPEADPVAYARIDRGAGTYRLQIPKRELARLDPRRNVPCQFYHDIVESWLPLLRAQIDLTALVAGATQDVLARLRNRLGMETRTKPLWRLEVPRFAQTRRKRNAELANHGLATESGVRNTDGSQLLHAIRKREMDLISSARHAAELYHGELTGINHERGLSFTSPLPPTLVSDRDLRSRIVVFEDGKRLSPGHAMHDEIRSIGRGRYSHWGDTLYFSSSDGTDPRSNGRRYTVAEVSEDDRPMDERQRLDAI